MASNRVRKSIEREYQILSCVYSLVTNLLTNFNGICNRAPGAVVKRRPHRDPNNWLPSYHSFVIICVASHFSYRHQCDVLRWFQSRFAGLYIFLSKLRDMLIRSYLMRLNYENEIFLEGWLFQSTMAQLSSYVNDFRRITVQSHRWKLHGLMEIRRAHKVSLDIRYRSVVFPSQTWNKLNAIVC